MAFAAVGIRAQEAPPPVSPVTYTRDIAPLMFEACGTCHRPGGAAPFSLLSYTDVQQRATLITQVTKSRFMPPWKADADGGPFVGHRHLSDREIQMMERWVDAGAPEGDPHDLPPLPTWTDGWQLGPPDLVVTLGEAYVLPAGDTDTFRVFAIPIPIAVDRARFVRGIEFHPGNPRAVHHANMRLDRTSTTRDLDRADPRPGYDGLMPRTALYPDGHFLGWTPGQIAPLISGDLAWRLDPGTDLVVQLHMPPSGATESVKPEVGFYFSDEPPARVPSIVRLGSQGIEIPPGESSYRIGDSYVLPTDVELLAIQPHAHYRAKDITGTATLPDGTTKTLIHIGDWDFRWQHVYRYERPMRLPKGTRLSMAYTYDNSPGNPRNPQQPPARVLWGQRSADEMGDLWFQLVARDDRGRQTLNREVLEKMTAEDVIGYETLLRVTPRDAELHDDLALLYLSLGRTDKAVHHFGVSAALKPESAQARFNLGTALTLAGDFDRAIAEYERALEAKPDYAKARSNLGDALAAQGRLDEAIAQYRQAIRSDPTQANAHNNLGSVLIAAGDLDAARPHFVEALRLMPEYAEATYGLGRVQRARGDLEGAVALFNDAIRLKPAWPPPLVDLAWLLATSADASARRPDAAVRLAEEAVTLTQRRDASAFDALGAAYANAGRFDAALAAARAALRVGVDAARAAQIEQRIALYERQQPYRER